MSLQDLRVAQWYNGLQNFIMDSPEHNQLRPLFPKTPDQLEDIRSIRRQHSNAYNLIFRGLSRPAEGAMVDAIDDYVRQKLNISDKGLFEGKAVDRIVNDMDQIGYTKMPVLSAEIVKEMRNYFENQPCYAGPYDPDQPNRELFSFQELREQHENTVRYPTKSVLLCPHLVKIANDPLIISALESYLGTIPLILDYSCWWSLASEDKDSQHAQLFHIDMGDYRFCLMFIYLTNVDMGGGPHTYIEGTHELDNINEIRSNYDGDEEKWNDWFFMKLRKTDEEVDHYLNGLKPVSLTGPEGSSFLVNTRGIHKGMLPTTSDRLIIQIVYGITPMLQTEFDDPVVKDSPESKVMPDWLWKPPFDYVNWLFATQ